MEANNHKRRWLLIASYSSVGVAAFLILIKTSAWLFTGSASLLGSLLDSLMDSIASLVTMFAIRYSLRPADDTHRFGHGKAESLAALAQSGFIIGSGVLLFLYCMERFFHPQAHVVEHTTVGLAVMVCALVCTIGLVFLQSYVIRMTGSAAISADRLHYKSDILMNLSVLVALLFARRGFPEVDLALGVLIALYISFGALQIGRDALGMLMDRELPPEVDRRIYDIAMAHEGVIGVHDLRTRQAGTVYVIQLHIELPDTTSLLAAHRAADDVEVAILREFPGADVIIHQDPLSVVPREQSDTSQIFEVPEAR